MPARNSRSRGESIVLRTTPAFPPSSYDLDGLRRKQRRLYFHTELPFDVVVMARQTDTHWHRHEFAEIALIVAGEGRHEHRDRVTPLQAGDWVSIMPGEVHRYRDAGDAFSLINLLYEPERLRGLGGDLAQVPGFAPLFDPERRDPPSAWPRLTHVDLEPLQIDLRNLGTELILRRPGYGAVCFALFWLAAARLARLLSRVETPSAPRLSRVGHVAQFIQTNYPRKIAMRDLCRLAHMSPSGLMRAFRETLGAPPMRYLLRVRCLRAAECLAGTDWSMTEIAMRVGFGDGNYFCRQFKRHFKVSPSRYRALHRGNDTDSSSQGRLTFTP